MYVCLFIFGIGPKDTGGPTCSADTETSPKPKEKHPGRVPKTGHRTTETLVDTTLW